MHNDSIFHIHCAHFFQYKPYFFLPGTGMSIEVCMKDKDEVRTLRVHLYPWHIFPLPQYAVGRLIFIYVKLHQFKHSYHWEVRNQKTHTNCSKSAAGLAVILQTSGYVPFACYGLMITSLLQVINRLDASWLIYNLQEVYIHQIASSRIFTNF